MVNHSPTPWKLVWVNQPNGKRALWIETANGDSWLVCVFSEEDIANAEFSVKAANNHDKLVAALEEAREALASVTDDTDRYGQDIITADTAAIQVALSSVNKALAGVRED